MSNNGFIIGEKWWFCVDGNNGRNICEVRSFAKFYYLSFVARVRWYNWCYVYVLSAGGLIMISDIMIVYFYNLLFLRVSV